MQPHDQDAERQALAVLDRFMEAFSAHDWEGTAATMNFPHVRLASGHVKVWDSAEEYVREMPSRVRQIFERDWDRSAWDEREPLQSTPDKVHVRVCFSRYSADGVRLATYPSLWIVTRQADRWGIQARSSFAP